MLHALFPAHELDHLAEWHPGIFAPKQEASAALEQHGEILDVRPGEVVQAHLERMQNDVRRHDAELREVREERDVAHADFCKLFDHVLLPLEIPELVVQLGQLGIS